MNTLWIGLRCLAVILLLFGAAPQSRAQSMSGSMAMMMATDAPTAMAAGLSQPLAARSRKAPRTTSLAAR